MDLEKFVSGLSKEIQEVTLKFISNELFNRTIGDLANVQQGPKVSVVREATNPLPKDKGVKKPKAVGPMSIATARRLFAMGLKRLQPVEAMKWRLRRYEYGIRKCVRLMKEGRLS